MIFGKKNKKNTLNCETCSSSIASDFRFCPYCGISLVDLEDEMKEFGMLGRIDENRAPRMSNNMAGMDKIVNSLMNSLMKNMDAQFKEIEKTEIKSFPNGIRINLGVPPVNLKQPQKQVHKKHLTDSQLQRMADLPRATAKTNVRRLSDKVVYELLAPGIISEEDVFISKLENGYEIKAIGDKKVYVNSLPLSLPLRKISIVKNKLLIEFKLQQE